MVVLFLTVMIAMILLRALRKDIANYNDASFLEGTYVQLFIIIISPFLLSHSVTYFIINFSINFFCQFFPTVRNKYLPFLFVSFLIFFLFSPTLSLLLIFFTSWLPICYSHPLHTSTTTVILISLNLYFSIFLSFYLSLTRSLSLSLSLFFSHSFSLSLFPSLSSLYL